MKFSANGYMISSVPNKDPLFKIREKLLRSLDTYNNAEEISLANISCEKILDLNNFRVETMRDLNADYWLADQVWHSIKQDIISLLGPDILSQKRVNLVIQPPFGLDNAPLHRDAPPHSPFEIVVWIPLVDVAHSNSMYVCNLAESRNLEHTLSNKGQESFEKQFWDLATPLNCKFGEYVIFLSQIFHSPKVNETSITRWSLNTRYKNLFSPIGPKSVPDYYRIQTLSEISNLIGGFND